MSDAEPAYDAVLVVSFGGPEKPDDVLPFLENVVRGRDVPRERLEEVAAHYENFGGKSPINDACRALVDALKTELDEEGHTLPVYWGNRNWHPMLADTLAQMRDDGVQRALAFVTSGYSSYSGCRQYLDDIEAARREVGEGAPQVDKLRVFYNHPGLIESLVDSVQAALVRVPSERRAAARIAFTAHSVPLNMAESSNYVKQLEETCGLVAEGAGRGAWQLVFQSRSGSPSVPWLAPDILEHIDALSMIGTTDLVIVPVGFVMEHVEVLWDLDHEARERCEGLDIAMVRARTVDRMPRFVTMIRELIEERLDPGIRRQALGTLGPSKDLCSPGCCVPAPRPAATADDA